MDRRLVTAGVAAGVVLGGLLAAGQSRAETVDGRVRLGLEGAVLGHTSTTLKPSGGTQTGATQTSFGLATADVGVGIAYGLSDAVMLGGRVAFLSSALTFDDDRPRVDRSASSLLADLSFVFGSGDVLPFVGPCLGLASENTEQGGVKTKQSDFRFGAVGGLRAFAAKGFSVDPTVHVLYSTGDYEAGAFKASFTGTVLLLGFAFSGWLGDGSPPAAAAAPVEDEASEPERGAAPTMHPEQSLATDGRAETTIDLADGERLRLTARPGSPSAEFLLILAPGEGSKECSAVSFRAGDAEEPLEVTKGSVVSGFGSASPRLVVTGSVSRRALRLAAGKGDVTLVACDRQFPLDEDVRRGMKRFLSDARRLLASEQEEAAPAPPEAGEDGAAPNEGEGSPAGDPGAP